MKKPYPTKLQPIPIVSAVVELKFSSIVPSEAVFGMLYAKLSDTFPNITKLPILQMPLEIREKEPNLMYLPNYELYNDDNIIKISIGPKVLAVIFNKHENEYPGWTLYLQKEVQNIFKKAFETGIIGDIHRIGIRYTDFFEDNIFEHINLSVKQETNNIAKNEKIQLTRQVCEGLFIHQINISNNAGLKIFDEQIATGSIIDIDTYIEHPSREDFHSNYVRIIQDAHELNKEHFFKMLDEEYINGKYNPSF